MQSYVTIFLSKSWKLYGYCKSSIEEIYKVLLRNFQFIQLCPEPVKVSYERVYSL